MAGIFQLKVILSNYQRQGDVIGTFLSPFFIARLEDNTHQTHLGTDNGGVLKETRNIPRQQQQ